MAGNYYPNGTRIRLIAMPDPPETRPIEMGTEGSVEHIGDAGQIHIKWDNGRYLAIIPGFDQFEVLP